MESFTQKTKIDLPDIRKRQTYKNKEKEIDYFNLLFEDNSETENVLLGSVRHRRKFLQGYQFYLAIVFVLFIAACFLVVQMVVNSPEIEKYKAATKNIEEIDTEDKSEEPKSIIPEVQFANDVIKKPNPVISKKPEVGRKIKQKTIAKPSHVIVYKKLSPATLPKSQSVSLKKTESKVQEAVLDIMLRPLVISEPMLRRLD